MNIAVIFAGGVGRRVTNAARPKQFLKLYGKEIIIYTLERFELCKDINTIIVACVKEWIPYLHKIADHYEIHKLKKIVPGGNTGQESIYLGLKEAWKISGNNDDIVLIHDGVRPFINEETILDNIQSVKKNGSAITVTPAVETIVRLENSKVAETFDRSACCLARAPQSFYLKEILDAHEKALKEGRTDFIDCAAMMNYYGMRLSVVKGPEENIKITTPVDFLVSKAFYEAEEHSQIFGIK